MVYLKIKVPLAITDEPCFDEYFNGRKQETKVIGPDTCEVKLDHEITILDLNEAVFHLRLAGCKTEVEVRW